MIAEQTHKSSINPWGLKEALFSSSRQPSQTEHHHKPYPPTSPPSFSWSLQPLLAQSFSHSLLSPVLILYICFFFSFYTDSRCYIKQIHSASFPLFLLLHFIPLCWPRQGSLVIVLSPIQTGFLVRESQPEDATGLSVSVTLSIIWNQFSIH